MRALIFIIRFSPASAFAPGLPTCFIFIFKNELATSIVSWVCLDLNIYYIMALLFNKSTKIAAVTLKMYIQCGVRA